MDIVRGALEKLSNSTTTTSTSSSDVNNVLCTTPPPPLPVTVLSGFLGAGKTTGEWMADVLCAILVVFVLNENCRSHSAEHALSLFLVSYI